MSPAIRTRMGKLQCATKRLYSTEAEAQAAATWLRKKTGGRWRAYRCVGLRGQPKHWHLTSGRKW